MSADPFGTRALRTAALDAWRSSPTRFREDANAEEDLVLGGYRDRWFAELAQNAADAASRAGRPGTLRVAVVDGELRVANTGEPLTAGGVAALASLRASVNRTSGSVGRFGVGFAAVLPISGEPRVVSTSGGVRFSADRTRQELLAEPVLRDELAHRRGAVPVLRLVWPTGEQEPGPPAGFDTEVRLPVPAVGHSGVPDRVLGHDGRPSGGPALLAELLAQAAEQAPDLLLAFPALHRIELPGRVWTRQEPAPGVAALYDGDRETRWRLIRRHGELPARLRLAAEEHHRPEWTVCWAVVVADDGTPRPAGHDVLHAPTPTDERLSLPARLLATLPVEPDRRRVRAGAAADFVLAQAVRCYPELVAAVPQASRTELVPRAGFPLSELDGALRDGVLATLRPATWLPGAAGAEVAPATARVLDQPSGELTELLADLVPGLLAAPLGEPRHAAALAALAVPRLGLADVVAAVSGIDRPPRWWWRLYQALASVLDTAGPSGREELAALPVPLADGRTGTGPRSTLVLDQPELAVPGLRVVHADAVHPLLLRLGAHPAGPRELLESAALREAVERSLDDAEAGLDPAPLAGTVLRLVELVHAAPAWLGALALPDAEGEHRRADELVLPDGALRDVLAPGGPLGVLHGDVARAHPREVLRAVGVLDGFAVVDEEDPAGPDHDLADEEQWWASLPGPPHRLLAVRDLDLVDDQAWSRALQLIAAEQRPSLALHAQPSYTGWWLARYARLGGRAPRHWRLPSAVALAGLYDPVPAGGGLGEHLLRAAGVRADLVVADAEDAADLLARLADPGRDVPPAEVIAAHAALAAAVRLGRFGIDDVEPPPRVRAITGAVTAASEALVLDRPWLAAIAAPDTIVAGGAPQTITDQPDRLDKPDRPDKLDRPDKPDEPDKLDEPSEPDGLDGLAVLADLLDLPMASERLSAQVVSTGREVMWARLPEVAAACQALGRRVPPGHFVQHDELLVRTADGAERAVPYWVDAAGTVHAADPLRALIWLHFPVHIPIGPG